MIYAVYKNELKKFETNNIELISDLVRDHLRKTFNISSSLRKTEYDNNGNVIGKEYFTNNTNCSSERLYVYAVD